jgi:ABC-type multidrug transport system fused ATPase/permease subunit
MRETVRKLNALLTPAQRRRWLLLAPLLCLTGVVETVATGLVFLLIKIASEPTFGLRAPGLGRILAYFPGAGGRGIVLGYGAFLAAFFVCRSLLLLVVKYVEARAVADTIAGLSARVLESYLAAPFAVHLRHSSSELAYDATSAVDRAVEQGMGSFVQIVAELLVSLGLAVFLIAMAPLVTLGTAFALVLMAGTALRVTKRSSRRWGRQREDLSRQAQKDVQQSLGGIRELKVLGRERSFLESFAALGRRLARMRQRHQTLMAVPRLAIETIFVCCVVLIMALAQTRHDGGSGIVPLLGLYAYAGFRMIPSANRLIFQVDVIRGAARAIAQLHEHLSEFGGGARLEASADEGRPALKFEQALVLDRVSFGYEGGHSAVLTEVSAVIRRGESVAVVGATGAGKSTLIDLVLGLLHPTSGRITVDGVDIQTARRAWQSRIGYVPQAAFLFEDSIRKNVALGIPLAEIDEERLREALRMAQLADFVATLPEGLDTLVGERGVRLSGGQRQRVAIARALYHQPEMLVFDEATAALDNQTEREVTRAIEGLKGRKTVLIIAHRLTTVRRCDSLLFLREGRVHAAGSFDRLLEDSPEFRAMAALSEPALAEAAP